MAVTSTVPSVGIPRPPTAFVAVAGACCGHGSVVAFDPTAGTVHARITVGGTPTAAAATPDAARVLVSNRFGYVSVIDTASYQHSDIGVCTFANGIAVTPNGRTAVVTCADQSAIQLVDLSNGTVGSPIAIGEYPSLPGAVAITPDGAKAYIVNFNGTAASDWVPTVVPVLLHSGAVLPAIRLSRLEAAAAAITPDGRRLLVGARGTTTSGSGIDVIDTTTDTVSAGFSVPSGPDSIAISADGATAYVSCRFDNTVVAVNLDGGTPPASRSGIDTSSVALTPDGKTILSTAGYGQEVDILGVPGLTPRGYISTEYSPVALVVTPDQAPRAALDVRRQYGPRATFDASASSAPSTPIASYSWDFGDGTKSVTTTPTATHTYRRIGTYTARVTLTDTAGTSLQQVFTGQTVARNGSSSATAAVTVDVSRGARGPQTTRPSLR